MQKKSIFDVFYRFCCHIEYRHDDFENFLIHILKKELFYPPMDGVLTRFRDFFNVKITICYEQTLFFSRLFFSKPPYQIPATTKLNSGDRFGKSTLEDRRILISRRIAHDSIIFYKVRNTKENLGHLGVNKLNQLPFFRTSFIILIPKILKTFDKHQCIPKKFFVPKFMNLL